MTQPSFYLTTLGCKVNQYEGHALREAWLARGLREAAAPEDAACIVVNSCAVTAKAVADVRNTVRRLNRAAPATPIVITGCAAQTLGEELRLLPGVVAVLGQKDKEHLLQSLPIEDRGSFPATTASSGLATPRPEPGGHAEMLFHTQDPPAAASDPTLGRGAPRSSGSPTQAGGNAALPRRAPPVFSSPAVPVLATAGAPPEAPFPSFVVSGYDRSRAVLKIQDGCSHRCTYCIVPLARGAAVSRSLESSLAEARRLLEGGFREIVISGINLRQYGGGKAHPHDFWDFLARLEDELAPEWAGRARFRISSLEPGQLGEKALETLARSRLVAPHLHLSLQSGSPSVLRRMGRGHYGPEGISGFLHGLRTVWPVFGLGADLLSGFPGESETEAGETLALCAALPLSYAHVFPYSRRPGTAAAGMAGQLPQGIKKSRAAALRALVQAKQTAFLQKLAALPRVHVVFEERNEETGASHAVPRGVNEFYADCVLEAAEGAAGFSAFRKVTEVRPVRVAKGRLVVRLERPHTQGQGAF